MKKRTVYFLCVLEGAIVIAIELLAGQMMAPLYGATFFSWTAVISVAITFLAAGYFTASAIIGRSKDFSGSIRKILLAASAYILFLILTLGKLPDVIYSNERFFLSMFVTAFYMAAVPCYLLALLPPLLIQQLGAFKMPAGIASGKIFFLSTAAAIVSCFLTGFFLLPQLGILLSLKIIFGVLLLAVLLFQKNKIILSLAVIFATLILLMPAKHPHSDSLKVLEKSEGINGQLMIVDAPRTQNKNKSYRLMFINRMAQTWVEQPGGNPMWSYVDYMVYVCGTKMRAPKILLLGLGGGTVANRLVNTLGAEVHAVELDPRIADGAKKYFSLKESVRVIVDDARHYINTCSEKYDFVLFDVFKGEVPPSHVLTLESLNKVNALLTDEGVVVINYNGFLTGDLGIAGRSVAKTVFASGYQCKIFFTSETEDQRNCLVIGTKGISNLNKSTVTLSAYGKPVDFETSHIDADKIITSSDFILTDNFPVLDYLNLEPGLVWRRDFYNTFTKKYLQEGIALFD